MARVNTSHDDFLRAKWFCERCGHETRGDGAPDHCPKCGHELHENGLDIVGEGRPLPKPHVCEVEPRRVAQDILGVPRRLTRPERATGLEHE